LFVHSGPFKTFLRIEGMCHENALLLLCEPFPFGRFDSNGIARENRAEFTLFGGALEMESSPRPRTYRQGAPLQPIQPG
jgi:hypothetical protein